MKTVKEHLLDIAKKINIRDELIEKFVDSMSDLNVWDDIIHKEDYDEEDWNEILKEENENEDTEILFLKNYDSYSKDEIIKELKGYIFYSDETYNQNWTMQKIKRAEGCSALYEYISDETYGHWIFDDEKETYTNKYDKNEVYKEDEFDLYDVNGVVVYSNDEWDI